MSAASSLPGNNGKRRCWHTSNISSGQPQQMKSIQAIGMVPLFCRQWCVCEANYCEEWRKCEVIALFKQSAGMVAAFIVDCGNGVMSLDAYGADCLRPIRSERETAIEDMKQITKAAADAHKRELHGALSEEYLLGALYDAGHRKVKP
ncbi:hypothetical protein FLM52_05235 [bacterium Scap17]|nr:hypothetical protein [bacterium Scap17]